jgi:serine/threonine protein kinase
MRAFGSVSEEDLLNEARAIDKLKASGRCENIVLVFKHGWLEGSSYYFIDMELCGCNLEHFTKGEERSSYLEMKNPRFFGAMLSERGLWSTWDIMEQICAGIEFIHHGKQIHRDLKPRNGKSSP